MKSTSKILSLMVAVIMIVTALQGICVVGYAEITTEPTLLFDQSKLGTFGGSYYSSTGSKSFTDSPVSTALMVVGNGTASAVGQYGFRNANNEASLFQVSAANTYVVVSYWVMAESPSNAATKIRGSLQYCTSTASGGSSITAAEAGVSGEQQLQSGTWYKCYQVFKIAETYDIKKDETYNYLRFVLSAGYVSGSSADNPSESITTYLGGLKAYDFGASCTAEDITAYLEADTLSDITNNGVSISGFDPEVYEYDVLEGTLGTVAAKASNAEAEIVYNTDENGQVTITVKSYSVAELNTTAKSTKTYVVKEEKPYVNALSQSYNMGSWILSNKSYLDTQSPLMLVEDGRTAMKFWGKDSAFVENGAGNGSGTQYRGQLNATYIDGGDTWQDGDKLYISFYAKAHSNYGNATQLRVILQGVTSAESGGTTLASSSLLSLTDSWKKYSMVLTISNRAETDVNVRVCLNIGYKGQITYLSDFEMYKCKSELSDAYILNYFDGKVCENISKTTEIYYAGLSTYGHCDTEEIADTSLPFTTAKKYYSDAENYSVTNSINAYRARKQTTAIIQDNLAAGDKIMLIYWAKGSVDENVAEGQTSAKIRPLLQKDASGSNAGSIYQLTADGATDTSEISVTDQWQRYVSIFELPDMGENELRFEWQLGYKGQTVYLADAQIYNLGQISVAEAFSKIGITDLDGYYRTRKMNLSDSTFTADAENGTTALSDEDFTFDSEYPFVEIVDANLPSDISGSGTIIAVSPNGTKKTYSVNATEMSRIAVENISYKSGSAATKIILKMDDLWAKKSEDDYTKDYVNSLDGFQKIVDICKEKGITASFGIVGHYWENASDEQWNLLKSWQDDGFEIWHHGWDHTVAEYSTESYESQYESFKKTLDLMKAHDINIRIFGSPENNSTIVTSQMIVDNFADDIDATLLIAPNEALFNGGMFNMINRVYLESETGVANYDTLTESFDTITAQNNADYVVIQAHPSQWQDKYVSSSGATDYFAVFEEALDYLLQKDTEFVTPSQYMEMRSRSELSTVQSGDITATVTLSSGYANEETCENDSAVLIYALYDKLKNEMISCDIRTVSVETLGESTWQASVTVPDDGGTYETRLFVWDGLKSLVPYGDTNFLPER